MTKGAGAQVSIIIPTYNESKNVLEILKSIGENLPWNMKTEAIVVDDNSPDGTGHLVEEYINGAKRLANYTIDVVHRRTKNGLSSAVLSGIQRATGDIIVVMDGDFSHPPHVIPRMVDIVKESKFDLVIASRYVRGGAVRNWSKRRKVLSRIATRIAQKGLGINTKDPMSGFFAFKKNVISDLKFDAIGYKILLEILVKARGVSIKEIPYTFSDRKIGSSKISARVVLDYIRSIWKLYRYGSRTSKEPRTSVRFLSKAARFYTVGASGLGINYLVSLLLAGEGAGLWYLHANTIGILASMTSNFMLNKLWTFEDKNLAPKRTMLQYFKFIGVSSLGALVQLGSVFGLVEYYSLGYPVALILSVGLAAFGNFVLNKKITFKEKVWS